MKNKTTYEMEDIMGLITRDLAEKGLAPDPGSIVIRAAVAGAGVQQPSEIEIDVSVSWVGTPSPSDVDPAPARGRARRVPEPAEDPAPAALDLLDEAPSPRDRPVLEIGHSAGMAGPEAVLADDIGDVTTVSTRIARSGGAGPFAPERVRRRLSADETTEWPGNTPPRGR